MNYYKILVCFNSNANNLLSYNSSGLNYILRSQAFNLFLHARVYFIFYEGFFVICLLESFLKYSRQPIFILGYPIASLLESVIILFRNFYGIQVGIGPPSYLITLNVRRGLLFQQGNVDQVPGEVQCSAAGHCGACQEWTFSTCEVRERLSVVGYVSVCAMRKVVKTFVFCHTQCRRHWPIMEQMD